MAYHNRYDDVLRLTIEVAGYEVVDGQIAADEATFHHQIATGAMTAEVLADCGFDPLIQRLGAIAGSLHDAGKYHPAIRDLMRRAQGRAFTPRERGDMQAHTVKGHESIAGLQRNYKPELEIAAFTALHHHDVFTEQTYREYHGVAGMAHLVQLCDVGQARLLDKSRTYTAARDGAVLEAQTIADQIIQQFSSFPPVILGKAIQVEPVVRAWQRLA